jgi:hypothetical protein
MGSSSPHGSDEPFGKQTGKAYIIKKRKFLSMDERLLDVIIGFAAFLILIVLLAVLPMVMAPMTGYAYLFAIICFILFLSGAGYWVNEQIT